MSASYEVRGGVAVITMNNPPVNGLGLATRMAIVEALDQAQSAPQVRAIVLAGAGAGFSAGADIREFGSPKAGAEPSLLSVIAAIEASGKPVVAAIHGTCMGGGLELALGCHYRLAASGTQMALPEVKLGLLPGAGGTQRLPRVLGLEAAMNLIVSGEAVSGDVLAKLTGQRLFDEVVGADVIGAAIAFANTVAGERPLPRVRDLPVAHRHADGFVQFTRNMVTGMSKNFPAPLKCIDVVAAALRVPFEEGLRLEREAFVALMFTPESKALRHAFMAERAATKVADIPADTPPREVRTVAVIGAGTMGSGITMNFLNAGVPVVMLDTSEAAVARGVQTIRSTYQAQLEKGKLKQDRFDARMALLTATQSYGDLRDADLVIEAVFEDMAVKETVFRTLDEVARPGAIIATNTSTLDVNRIASFTRRPQDVIGMHFFSPAHVMRLLEVVRGEHTAKDVLATVMALGRKIRKVCVVSGVCDGFIGNRMIDAYSRQAGKLIEEGASPAQVDRAIERFGMAMGPFRMSDLAGNDISWAIRKRRYVEQPGLRRSVVADRLCEMGRFGQKSGAGWYDYVPGKRDAMPSPLVQELLDESRKAEGLAPRRIDDAEIVERLVYALVNEGARIVEEGIAQRASDVDMVYLTGYGFPAHRGGPMCYADTVGLFNVVAAMKRFAANPHDEPGFWQPAALLSRLAHEGATFS
jgi:3-hydroxyacyl-CoA dehydrogenase